MSTTSHLFSSPTATLFHSSTSQDPSVNAPISSSGLYQTLLPAFLIFAILFISFASFYFRKWYIRRRYPNWDISRSEMRTRRREITVRREVKRGKEKPVIWDVLVEEGNGKRGWASSDVSISNIKARTLIIITPASLISSTAPQRHTSTLHYTCIGHQSKFHQVLVDIDIDIA